MDATFYQGTSLVTETDAVTPGANPSSGIVGAFRCYTSAAIAAAAVGVTSAPALYNPPNSGVVLRVQAIRLGVVGGTVIAGTLGYAYQNQPVLSGLTAGPAPLSTFLTRGAPFQGLWYSALTLAAAPTFIGSNGLSAGGALAAGPLFSLMDPVNGFIVIPPGVIFLPFVANAAVALTALVTLDVIQTPMLTGF
jgi:hypothetical protein